MLCRLLQSSCNSKRSVHLDRQAMNGSCFATPPALFRPSPRFPSTQKRRRNAIDPHPTMCAEATADSNVNVDEDMPICQRSKMILTRRVFSWTVRRSARMSGSGIRSMDGGKMKIAPQQKLLTQMEPLSIESALSAEEPVGTFAFHRGVVGYGVKRRSGDPPSRYLQLRYGHVMPCSAIAGTCSNPRATGGLKGWYGAANQWKVLRTDMREPLVLEERQRFRVPKRETMGEKEIKVGRREAVSCSVPLVMDGKWSRALGRAPRVIVIGDVHGCISELQQLLRLADFQPGDQVVFLGDLVAKGPDSVGVVQLAREIGARTVRGNHDFEVVRWWEAHVRGDRNAMVSMEHARIAKSLGADEHMWLLESPWFIECEEMGHLFVHAGFIPGVKLTQQNPRLMMNMRSVLVDGTVTAKNVMDCQWAKLWRGPQTVVFGHDAFRGLQLYDYAKGIDTGCVYGGRLTALLLPENRMISVAAKRPYISPKRFRSMPRP